MGAALQAKAIVLSEPLKLGLQDLALQAPGSADVVVDIAYSGISTGTEKLLFDGSMPPFPGLSYPLVPGYESVGRVSEAPRGTGLRPGDWVFVPGANCFEGAQGLFGGAASRLVVPADRAIPLDSTLKEKGVLLALAATAVHCLRPAESTGREAFAFPELIIGHGVLGRLIARLTIALGGAAPKVWETDPQRLSGADGYVVLSPEADPRRDYARILDVSGASALLDTLISRLAPQGELVLGGFYAEPLSFTFPPAFLRELRLRVRAEWKPEDLRVVLRLLDESRLCLDGLITHRADPEDASEAYERAFKDRSCLKMILNWSAS